MIRLDGQTENLRRPDREWLETDGRGGYAASTLEGCHTRRYHGLLVANLTAPQGRHVLLSKLEDSLLQGGEERFLTSHRYPGVLFPPGPPLLAAFTLDTHPSFLYRAGEWSLQKGLLLVRGRSLLLIRYDLELAAGDPLLRIKPFLAFRGHHRLTHANDHLRGRTAEIPNGFALEPYEGMPPLYVWSSSPSRFTAAPHWYRRFQYEEERERGFDWEEDLFLPGILEIPLGKGGAALLAVSCDPPGEDPAALWEAEIGERRKAAVADEKLFAHCILQREERPDLRQGGKGDGKERGKQNPEGPSLPAGAAGAEREGPDPRDRELFLALLRAGRQFLVTTPSGKPAIIAGYPWFGSWGRDTLISLPGLAFGSGRIAEGVAILAELGSHEREGLLPNFFSADGVPEAYNTVDSSLLFFWAIQELLRATADYDLVRDRFWPVMKRIIGCFLAGTRHGIGVDERGLLHAGQKGKALTWMDALVEGRPVTPRRGCPVEINALWYNALALASELAERFADREMPPAVSLPSLCRTFREIFWNPERGCLGDVFNDGVLDKSLRPNQLFAVSLPFSPLDPAEQAGVVRAVREDLLTPCGLRTLSPRDPAYRGLYRGNGAARDSAYHQGTVWPWLLGIFGEAALRVAADKAREKEALKRHLRLFLQSHLIEAGIGSVSEVFDGDPPHRPGGCIAQAWSVAELIRLYLLLK